MLGELHSEIAKDLLKRVKSGQATPAEIGKAIDLIKHNQITSEIEKDDVLSELVNELPSFEDEANIHH
ncbi:hypothetical protein [Vibrio panuliri]|uniref:hypothetical protein n=1 Tax=Vibrio panuliri TaxID=1381081 RepID=UPI003F49B718